MFFMSRTVWPLAAGSLVVAMGWSQITLAAPDNQMSLQVVADIGGESARPYYVAIGGAGVPEHEGIQVARTAPYSIEDMLPVVTKTLSPGPVERRGLSLPAGFQPLFIVGDDPLSLSWLAARSQHLLEIGATGLAVNAQSAPTLQLLLDAVSGLRIDPVAGDDLAVKLGLSHYPALITHAGVEQ